MKPYQPKPHHNHTYPRGAILYACSVLALTLAMWFCAGVYGYHVGLELRPAAAAATAAATAAAAVAEGK